MDAPITDHTDKEPFDVALNTYRSLRAGMVVMVVMLGIAVAQEGLTAPCWQGSISAYYYTTAHSIFVAALCAIGALLIVYEGSTDTEDALLNLAGVMAFVVAMVPTGRPDVKSMCGRYVLPEYDLGPFITNNVWSVLIAFLAIQIFYWAVVRRRIPSRETSKWGIRCSRAFGIVIVVGLICFFRVRKQFDAHAHDIAATVMFLAIIATVAVTAFLVKHQDEFKSKHRQSYYLLYVANAATMLGTLSLAVLHLVFHVLDHWIIDLEALLIAEFAAYWIIQTIELRNTPNRYALLSEDAKQMLTKRRGAQPRRTDGVPTPPTIRSATAKRVLRNL